MTILASAAEVLRCFSIDRHDVTVTEIAALLAMPKSNVSRLLRTMRQVGFLDTVGETKRYRPGALLLQFGSLYRRASTLFDRADAVVAKVSGEVGHTGYVSVRVGREVLALTDHPGTNVLRVASTIGRRLSAFASATGRTLLARLDEADVRRLYPEPLAPPSRTAPQTLDELLERLARVRREGYAESNDESNRGVGALAVAVGDPETGEEASLCIAFPAATITAEECRIIIDGLTGGARDIATALGDRLFFARPEDCKERPK